MSSDTARFRTLLQRISSWFRSRLQHVIPFDSRAHSWARRVHSYGELPQSWRPFLDGLPAQLREPFPYLVLTPTFEGIGRQRELEKLVCLVDGAVHVVEHRGGRLSATTFPLQGQCWVERGVLLLYSWITIHDPRGDGTALSTTLRFNSVSEHHMAPFVEALRASPSGPSSVNPEAERGRFSHLAQAHFKFMSYGQGSIRRGDRVIRILLQPQIRRAVPHPLVFSRSRLVSAAHLTILTDSELILIRDDDRQHWSKGSPYGAIWTYIPRTMIVSAAISSKDGATEELSIRLTGGTRIESLFDSAQRGELQQISDALMT